MVTQGAPTEEESSVLHENSGKITDTWLEVVCETRQASISTKLKLICY